MSIILLTYAFYKSPYSITYFHYFLIYRYPASLFPLGRMYTRFSTVLWDCPTTYHSFEILRFQLQFHTLLREMAGSPQLKPESHRLDYTPLAGRTAGICMLFNPKLHIIALLIVIYSFACFFFQLLQYLIAHHKKNNHQT